MSYQPIQNYAIIGNLRSAALVSKEGSIDWAPAPFIDSPSIFAAILDDRKGGSWKIAPLHEYSSRQYYLENTNVLVTEFHTENGSIFELTDFIPIEKEKVALSPEEDTTFKIHRKIKCVKGAGKMSMFFNPKFDYARGKTTVSSVEGGFFVENKEKHAVLVSDCTMGVEKNKAFADFDLKEGEVKFFVLRYNAGLIKLSDEHNSNKHHQKELEENQAFWSEWVNRCELPVCPSGEPWEVHTSRSALLLKILFFDPIGTVAAAPTTSLPESLGGIRNWDYRYTWLRDSSFIFQAFFKLGHLTEAEEYINWLIDECYAQGGPEDLQIMYGLHGEQQLDEKILTHLEGYQGSKPVRIGNDAYRQKQWDIYGSVIDTIWRLYELKDDEPLDDRRWHVIHAIADYVTVIWDKPDEGLWEIRGGKRHYVYSKVMCWVALDRAIRFAKTHGFIGDIERWSKAKDAIREQVYTRGWNEKAKSFVQSFDSNDADASLLLLPVVGFIKGDDPKMLSTIAFVEERLWRGEGLLLRYTDDGIPGQEGAFLLASFWLVDALVYAGRVTEAHDLFETLLRKANHVGLFSEELNPETGDFLGNFPQAYTHIGLVNSAFLLSEALKKEKG